MQRIIGTYKGTGATLYIGLGFIPAKFEIINLTDRTGHLWTPEMGISALAAERYGLSIAAAGDRGAVADAAHGVVPYAGGDVMAANSTAYIVGPYDKDVRAAYAPTAPITAWTLGSASNKTGNFDVEASTAYVGPGSKVLIGGLLYEITAMTSNGEQANEVTLDAAAPSGRVQKIWSCFSYLGAQKGVKVPKGVCIGATAVVNDTDAELCMFIADHD